MREVWYFLFPFAASRHGSRWLELGGIALIALSVLAFTANSVWPGWLALVPVVGTMMVIYSARHESLLTGNRASQFLGKISYSVYLWHWPFAVWIYYFGVEREPVWVIAGMAASVLCGWLSYVYIESIAQVERGPSVTRPKPRPLVRIGGSMLAVGALASVTMASQGYPNRLSEEFSQRHCRTGAPAKIKWMVLL